MADKKLMEVETITLNSKSVELLLWKLSNITEQLKIISYSYLGPGWDGSEAKPITKQAIYRALNYLNDLPSLTDIPASTTMKDGSIWFEDEKGIIHAICTNIGTLLKERKEIDRFIGKVYGK